MEPKIGIIMGSDSDLPVMSEAAKILDKLQVPYELTVVLSLIHICHGSDPHGGPFHRRGPGAVNDDAGPGSRASGLSEKKEFCNRIVM